MPKLSEQRQGWISCYYCDGTKFSTFQDFIKHLSDHHCSRKGDLLICQYGENHSCNLVSDGGLIYSEYERHVFKHYSMAVPSCNPSRKSSVASNSSDKTYTNEPEWCHAVPAQNLPAVLNDPNKGKQKDLFTKTWGDNFVELSDVPEPNYLPHITIHHFEHYLNRIGQKHSRHLKLNQAHSKNQSDNELHQTFPNLRISKKTVDKNHFDISVIPKIFLQPNFDLSNIDTFNAVFRQAVPNNTPSQSLTEPSAGHSTKLLQEKLTHYLDMVEIQIAQQVSQKSDAFFSAMTSHDVLMEQLGQTISIVKTFREKIKNIDNSLVKESLQILRNERLRVNYHQVYRKVKVMATVMQTQPTIQLLLSSPDYVGALDLIHTTEDLLKQELAGIHSFRHLSSELAEMLGVIDTLMKEEFEKHSMADLNRPLLDSEPDVLEGDKLICIVMGMLRRGNSSFIDIYDGECVSAVKAAIKQAVIEVIARSDKAASADSNLEGQLRLLTVDEWTTLLSNVTSVLLKLLRRMKKGYDIMLRAVNASSGRSSAQKDNEDLIISESGDWTLSGQEEERALLKLRHSLVHISRYSLERSAQLLSTRSLSSPDDKTKEDYKNQNGTYWLAERATLCQLKMLSNHVKKISEEWDRICPDAGLTSLKSAFNIQAIKFMSKFHTEKMKKLFLLLESEPWRQIDVPTTFQELVNQIAENGTFSLDTSPSLISNDKNKTLSVLLISDEKFAVVGTVLMLVNIVAEYCTHAEEIPGCADHLHRYVSELLTQFNSRCYGLVLGGDAVSEKTGLKTITINNLALLLRSLHLILWLIPHVRVHFQGIIGELTRDYLDKVSQKVKEHAGDVNAKLLEVMHKNIAAELRHWDAKPPVPSKSFQNICKHLKKCHEAVSGVLPHSQIQELYRGVNSSFINTFSDKLQKMNILNNGGPTHGLVTQELLFYLEDLKEVKALPVESLQLSVINEEIWNHTIGR